MASRERAAFLKVRSALEASANIEVTDIYWGGPKPIPGHKTFGIFLDDAGRPINDVIPKMRLNGGKCTVAVKVTLLVRVLGDASTADTSDDSGITTETTGILDRWFDIQKAISGGTAWTGTTGVPDGYQQHRMTPVIAVALDRYPGYRAREANVEIDLLEDYS